MNPEPTLNPTYDLECKSLATGATGATGAAGE